MAKKKIFRWFKFIAWLNQQAEQASEQRTKAKEKKLLRTSN
jgi:hypothetical protein